jgi:hypothetical protein
MHNSFHNYVDSVNITTYNLLAIGAPFRHFDSQELADVFVGKT